MLTSVKLGLDYLKGKCERVFITPADVPFYTAETGSLKLACKQIGIFYSKGWKVISNIENQLWNKK